MQLYRLGVVAFGLAMLNACTWVADSSRRDTGAGGSVTPQGGAGFLVRSGDANEGGATTTTASAGDASNAAAGGAPSTGGTAIDGRSYGGANSGGADTGGFAGSTTDGTVGGGSANAGAGGALANAGAGGTLSTGGVANAGAGGALPTGGVANAGAGGALANAGAGGASSGGIPNGGASGSSGITVLSLHPDTLAIDDGGGTGIVTVGVDATAGPGGFALRLSASDVVEVPAIVTIPEGSASTTVRIRSAAGTGAAIVSASDGVHTATAAVSVIADPPAPSAAGQILIDEVNYDVPSSAPNDGFGDANCNGVVDAGSINVVSTDEFVELVNATNGPFLMDGVMLWDSTASPRFTFRGGFVLGPGEAVVVFGGALGTDGTKPWCTNADGAHIGDARAFAGPSGGLALNNSGDQVVVSWSTTKTDQLDSVTFGTGNDESIVRSPDIEGPLIRYTTAPGARSDRRSSPGTHVDGSPFAAFALE